MPVHIQGDAGNDQVLITNASPGLPISTGLAGTGLPLIVAVMAVALVAIIGLILRAARRH